MNAQITYPKHADRQLIIADVIDLPETIINDELVQTSFALFTDTVLAYSKYIELGVPRTIAASLAKKECGIT